MHLFYAIVHKDDDSAFGVEFPDLPGCFSAADDIDDVPRCAREALALWFEDGEDVVPRPLSVIRQEAQEALADGAFLIAVPHVSRKGKPVRVNISIGSGVLGAIDYAAKQRKLSRSAFLVEAAMEAIEDA